VRNEDAFLRTVHPGRRGEPPLGQLIDPSGVHFDSSAPSLLERILARAPLDDHAVLQRAREGMARLQALDLSKYNGFDPALPAPAPGYVLVVDQRRGDASVTHGNATAATFREMLAYARIEHPGARIVIKAHPDALAGAHGGYYGPDDCDDRTEILTAPHSPWRLLEGAIAVYTVSSQLGLEAIFAGHRPRVFGQPFYAGWGLTQDENPVARRERRLTRAQLFAASYILAPTWFDPCRKRLCSFEEAVDQLEASLRAFCEDRGGHVGLGIRLWKRRTIQQFFGTARPVRFAASLAKAEATARKEGRSILAWAGRLPRTLPPDLAVLRIEDGFLRSRGLGADLVPPLSLVTDRQGIYYDPAHPSDLEDLIARPLTAWQEARATRLLAGIRDARLTKYNLAGQNLPLPEGRRILVAGQVEDDASIRLGAGEICTNLALLRRARAENPGAVILFKPHPDVEAGLRKGHVPQDEALRHADAVLQKSDIAALLDQCDEVWAMTSLLGFEALLRGKRVTTTGAPFYAGWGLTRDLGRIPARRGGQVSLAQLVHAALIAYPRYLDPVTHMPCPPEVIVERLARGDVPRPGPGNRLLAKCQGLLASQAWIWR
jgi:capsular polysaccharide export protein